MRKQIKTDSSKILLENIEYHPGGDNSKLRELLFVEQKGFCAYTETYLGRTDQKDIDHFNPTKDFIDRNKYFNKTKKNNKIVNNIYNSKRIKKFT